MASMDYMPGTIKFRVEIEALVAIESHGQLNHAAEAIESPPISFSHEPTGSGADKKSYRVRNTGWVQQRLAIALEAKGLRTNWALADETALTDYYQDETSWGGGDEEWMKPIQNPLFDYEHVWEVCHNKDIHERQNVDAQWVGVTIRSPMYAKNEPKYQPPFQGLEEVLRILKEDFVAVTNHTTRLRILVESKEAQDALELGALKRIVTLIWVADPALTQLHPKHYGPGSFASLGLQYASACRKKKPIDVPLLALAGDTVPDPWDNRLSPNRAPIHLLSHPGELSSGFGYWHGLYDFQGAGLATDFFEHVGLAPRGTGDKEQCLKAAYEFGKGVRFGQHCGTLDFEAVSHWATVCANIVNCGIDQAVKVTTRLDAIQELRENKTYTPGRVLAVLGPSQATVDYYEKRGPAVQVPDHQQWPELKLAVPGFAPRGKAAIGEALMSYVRATLNKDLERLAAQLMEWDASPKAAYTVGVELEFQMAMVHSEAPDPEPSDSRECVKCYNLEEGHAELAKRMREAGCFARHTRFWDDELEEAVTEQAKEAGVRLSDDFPLQYQLWCVTHDASIAKYTRWRGYGCVRGVEVVSPILRDTPSSWESLLDTVISLRNRLRLTVDKSCGLHVNVGKGSQLMSARTLRKMLCLFYCADPIVSSLCHPFRRHSIWATPLRDKEVRDNVAHHWRQYDCPKLPGFEAYFTGCCLSGELEETLRMVWAFPSEQLFRCFEAMGDRGCVSLRRMANTRHREYKTGSVEFRYLEGTLDPQLILRFSKLMVAMVQFADNSDAEAFSTLAGQFLRCEEYGAEYNLDVLSSALKQLGLGEDATYWRERVLENRKLSVSEAEMKNVPDLNPETLTVLPPLSASEVACLRANVCRRQERYPYRRLAPSLADVASRLDMFINHLVKNNVPQSREATHKTLLTLKAAAKEESVTFQGRFCEGVAGLVLALGEVMLRDGIEARVSQAVRGGREGARAEKDPALGEFWATLDAGVGELDGLFREVETDGGQPSLEPLEESSSECPAEKEGPEEAADDERESRRPRLERSPNWNGGGGRPERRGRDGKGGRNRGWSFCFRIPAWARAKPSRG